MILPIKSKLAAMKKIECIGKINLQSLYMVTHNLTDNNVDKLLQQVATYCLQYVDLYNGGTTGYVVACCTSGIHVGSRRGDCGA